MSNQNLPKFPKVRRENAQAGAALWQARHDVSGQMHTWSRYQAQSNCNVVGAADPLIDTNFSSTGDEND